MIDWIEALERLAQLKASGLLSDEEFVAQKEMLLAQPGTAMVPPTEQGPPRRQLLWMSNLGSATLFLLTVRNCHDDN